MLKLAVRNSKKLIRQMTQEAGIRLGRFFTKIDTARLMASAFDAPQKPRVSLLDAGAGTGILSAAAIEALCQSGAVSEIYLTCYENNPLYLPMLANNLERIRKKARHDHHVKVRITICEEDFLSCPHGEDELYDFIITNPPHELENEKSLDHPFVALCNQLLAPMGQMVMVLPVASATAVTLAPFRKNLVATSPLEQIYL